jgi:hypothetical protein
MDAITAEGRCGARGRPLEGDDRKRYCGDTCRQKAHRVRQEARRERACLVCKTPIPPGADHRGRRPTYCGPACQQAARLGRILAEAGGAGAPELGGTPAGRQHHEELRTAVAKLEQLLGEIDRTRRRPRRTDPAKADAAAYRSLVQAVRSVLGCL